MRAEGGTVYVLIGKKGAREEWGGGCRGMSVCADRERHHAGREGVDREGGGYADSEV